jgi:C-8 sterol isomerase
MAARLDPEKLAAIAKGAVGLPREALFQKVIDDCATAWPDLIERRQDWMFNLCAGAVGMMTILHASLSEYLILFGTSVGTEAFSGRYRIDIWDWVLEGEMWTYTEQAFRNRLVTTPGEGAFLPRGHAKGYRLREDSWLLEYARGPVPTALPMGLGDAVFSGQDPRTIFKTLTGYGRQVVGQLARGKI